MVHAAGWRLGAPILLIAFLSIQVTYTFQTIPETQKIELLYRIIIAINIIINPTEQYYIMQAAFTIR
jgi:hypothetical protein